MTDAPQLYTFDEVAAMLCICRRTLLGEVKAGNIRYVLVGQRRRFAAEDVDEYIRTRRCTWPSIAEQRRRTGTSISRLLESGSAARPASGTKRPHALSPSALRRGLPR